jgi:hypothetical protein
MKKSQNRFSIVNSYKKEQSIELLGKLTVEQLLTIINNFNNKDILLNIINNSMSRSELQELLFKSSISDESLLNYLHQKNNKKINVIGEPSKITSDTTNHRFTIFS